MTNHNQGVVARITLTLVLAMTSYIYPIPHSSANYSSPENIRINRIPLSRNYCRLHQVMWNHALNPHSTDIWSLEAWTIITTGKDVISLSTPPKSPCVITSSYQLTHPPQEEEISHTMILQKFKSLFDCTSSDSIHPLRPSITDYG